jgi:hypothetical protein
MNGSLGALDDAPEQIIRAADRFLADRGAFDGMELFLKPVAESESVATIRRMADFRSTVIFG